MNEASAVSKPRVWPLFVLSIVELLFVSLLQVIAIVVYIVATRAEGTSVADIVQTLPAKLTETPFFVLLLVLAGVSMIGGALLFGWVSARNSDCSLTDRLGLAWPSISAPSWFALLLGSVPVLLVAVGAVILIGRVLPADESLLMLYENISDRWAIVFIVTIGVLPGIGEELFFRGFIQRRMLQRFSPWLAIGLTSIIFGLFHVTPHGIALATIMGVWLGVIAWRTNSIWPGACCHAFVNSGWNVYQVGRFQWGMPDIPPLWFSVVGGALVVAAFLWSVKILAKAKPAVICPPALAA